MRALQFRMTFISLAVAGLASPAIGQIMSWDASYGVLPYDVSIPPSQRFNLSGLSSFVSMQDGFMNVNETDTGSGMAIGRTDIAPIPENGDWAYEVELRINSHTRSGLDIACFTGVYDSVPRRMSLYFARDTIGFTNTEAWHPAGTYSMDTTDGFHVYTVVKNNGTVRVYVDDLPDPVISLAQDQFEELSVSSAVYLTQTSHPGVANFDLRRFSVNLRGTNLDPSIPAMSAWGLLTMGLLVLTTGSILTKRRPLSKAA